MANKKVSSCKSGSYIKSQVTVLNRRADQLENTEQDGPQPLSYSTDVTGISNNTAFKVSNLVLIGYFPLTLQFYRPKYYDRLILINTILI